MSRIYAVAALALALATPAGAQIMVIGGGQAKDCYNSAKFSSSPSEGEKICTRALSTETMNLTNRAATYTNRGVLRMRAGKYDAALNDYDIAKKMKPDVGATYLNEGAALIYKKDFNTALISLNKAIELGTPELFAAYYNRAIAKENTGDVPGAYDDFQKASELKPDWELVERQLSRFSVTGG